jgi:hypothetical protein
MILLTHAQQFGIPDELVAGIPEEPHGLARS